LIAISCIYFIYVFLDKKDVAIGLKAIFLALLSPILLLSSTSLNLSGFDITTCDAFKFEWFPFTLYCTLLGVLAMVWIFVLLVRRYHTAAFDLRKQIILMGTGIELFLFIFFIWTSFTYYLSEIGVLPDSSLEMYGMFGMVIFIIYISILIVRFKTFNVKLIATHALVWALVILVGSEFFFAQTKMVEILIAITLIVSAWLGLTIIRSVKKEIEQREQLAKLNIDLENLLKQRESLTHLITHKVKGAFTRIKVLFAGILDGTFGEISPEIKKRAEQGMEFGNGGLETVDLVLNVANMQNGTIKFEMKPVNFKELVEKTIAEKKISAEAKGLKLETEIKDGVFDMMGDAIWLKEVVNNLVENALHYTKEGKIVVGLEDGNGKIKLSVKDTGIGITDEDKKNLFTEGGRGRDSVKVNVDSTGYGLYTVKLVVEAHKGRLWSESEGPGKGSQFYVELPAGEKV
jgi:signal transduction histidine kinase